MIGKVESRQNKATKVVLPNTARKGGVVSGCLGSVYLDLIETS